MLFLVGVGLIWAIYGTGAEPGLTPRGVNELFKIINRDGGKYSFAVSCYMLELYQVGGPRGRTSPACTELRGTPSVLDSYRQEEPLTTLTLPWCL